MIATPRLADMSADMENRFETVVATNLSNHKFNRNHVFDINPICQIHMKDIFFRYPRIKIPFNPLLVFVTLRKINNSVIIARQQINLF